MKNRKMGTILPFVAAVVAGSLTGCGEENYDVTLVVYNWEDYIYEGLDEDGNIIDEDGGVCERFQKYYEEKTGLKVKVDYQCFSTNEIMYSQIKMGGVTADLICPSDYMIQKMANENMLEPFSYDESTKKYADSLSNWATYGSPYIRDKFANEKLENGKSFLSYAVPYFWGTMGFTYRMDSPVADYVNSWECIWDTTNMKQKFTLKDSLRDSYVAAIFHVYKDEIAALDETASDYNDKLTAIFNRCDNDTIAKVEEALKAAKNNAYGFQFVDSASDFICNGNTAFIDNALEI